ncbi:PEP/pyruvate-binding domain-containing protein [Marisediminicola antarctica]|uniref:Phosphoenolpyruvate synthase n=1 Tax=Marisediminicola antarctica TaxID=674079 RepID=A0A7L5AF33_9MICO|nr:PEP/pyruvate-binding domain-containing protein [Marisediminicola antarctica]QHO68542.1 phosphoenolpyruvate synthase [Marisediminicola antarctica]
MSNYTFAFDSTVEPLHDRLGGKCASLAKMTSAGSPVPPGFAVTTEAFDAVMGAGLRAHILEALAGLDMHDTADVTRRATAIRALIMEQPVPDAVRDATIEAYERLMALCGGDVPVAVRSSATAEDLPDASFAGQQDTYLWVTGLADVLLKIRECWASLYTDRAISYRAANNITDDGLSMAVGVQKMVNARTAGVAMTIDPSNGDRSKIVIDSSWGLGELVVSGEVTPDNFLIDKVMLSVVRRTVSDKAEELVPDPDRPGLIRRGVDAERRTQPSLSDDELASVALLAKTAERYYGCPQDIEWALDADLPAGSNILLLQSRPETVWSQRASSVSTLTPGFGIGSIARSLLGQVGAR